MGLNFQYYNSRKLVPVILFLGTFISLIIELMKSYTSAVQLINAIQFPTTGAIVYGLLTLYNTKLWKKKYGNWLVTIPNMNGRYEGYIQYNYNGERHEKKCSVEVVQTGSSIKLSTYFEKKDQTERSRSVSLIENIRKREDGSYEVVFTYQNYGIQTIDQPHYGTNILRFIQNDSGTYLKGLYYTNRKPQTKGKMEVKFMSNQLKYDY